MDRAAVPAATFAPRGSGIAAANRDVRLAAAAGAATGRLAEGSKRLALGGNPPRRAGGRTGAGGGKRPVEPAGGATSQRRQGRGKGIAARGARPLPRRGRTADRAAQP